MKRFKTIRGFVKHLSWVADHDVTCLQDADKYTQDELDEIVAIKADIDNGLGDLLRLQNKE